MCLITVKNRYFRARYDIPCYKLVYVNDNGTWSSAFGYSGKEFEFDKVLVETKGRPKPLHARHGDIDKHSPFVELRNGYFYSAGMAESCLKMVKDAKELRMESGLPHKDGNFAVLNCTIPKGTVYYTGEYKYEYASRKIIVHKPAKW